MNNLGCFLNGEWVALTDAKISVLAHTLHYATGVFEGLRSYNGKIFKLEAHTKRLLRSAKLIGLEVPYPEAQLNTWQQEVITRNQLKEAYIRPFIFSGEGPMNLNMSEHPTQVLICAWPKPVLHAGKTVSGIKLKTVSVHKLAINSTQIKAKAVGHYLNSALALQEAKAKGADEALLLDQKGFICEGSGQNLFFIREGKLYTPTTETALDGITRATVIELAEQLGLTVSIGDYTLETLHTADEIFLTGTATEIIGAHTLNDLKVGKGNYPTTALLQQAYQDLVKS